MSAGHVFFKHLPGLHNLSSSIFFHSTLWVLKESIYNKNLITRAVLRN
jgi:hypothetical protein